MLKESIDKYLNITGFKEFAPKAVMFDMDGVIYNSMPNHAKSWHKAMKSIGIEMPSDDAYTYEGMRGVETIQLLFKKQRNEDISTEKASEYKAKNTIKSNQMNSTNAPKQN